jgi:hypothetical protein
LPSTAGIALRIEILGARLDEKQQSEDGGANEQTAA